MWLLGSSVVLEGRCQAALASVGVSDGIGPSGCRVESPCFRPLLLSESETASATVSDGFGDGVMEVDGAGDGIGWIRHWSRSESVLALVGVGDGVCRSQWRLDSVCLRPR